MRPEGSRDSILRVASFAGAVVGAFFAGLVASGAFWYALFSDLQSYTIPVPAPVFVWFGVSVAVTWLFAVASVNLRRRLPMRYTIVPFMIGGLLAAMAIIAFAGISAWADWVTATSG